MKHYLPPLSFDCLNDVIAFRQLKSIWQTLELKDPHCSPFNTWDWLSLWWTHYARQSSYQLKIIIARRGRRVVAIAPMYIAPARHARLVPINVLRFIGTGCDTSPDYMNFICEPSERIAAEKGIVDYLFTLDGWQKMALTDVSKASSLSRCIAHAFRTQSGYAMHSTDRTIHRANLPASWEDYRSALSRKRRKQINHRQNRLDAAGHNEISLCANREDLHEAIDALIELHRLRWQSKGEAGGFRSDEYVAFHRSVIETFFARDNLWLATLKLDGRIIGVQYIFLWHGELLYFQSGYSPEHESLSPGHVLFTYTIQRAIEQGLYSIDMLKGDYGYKNTYAKLKVETCDYAFIRPGVHALIQKGRQWASRLAS